MDHTSKRLVTVTYTNWKGVTSERTILPRNLIFGSNEYHPEPQWLLECLDVEKNADRTFALKDITEWAKSDHVPEWLFSAME